MPRDEWVIISEKDFGQVVTIIGDKPYKFNVRGLELGPDSNNITNQFTFAYLFKDVSKHQSIDKIDFEIRIRDEVESKYSTEDDLHNAAIRIGLLSKKDKPKDKKFDITLKEWNSFASEKRLDGQELSAIILKFYLTFYKKWPGQGIGLPDLQDNFNNSEEELQQWHRHLIFSQSLTKTPGNVTFRMERGFITTSAYTINPMKFDEIEKIVVSDMEKKIDANSIKIFLSYSTKNRKTASDLKDHLEKYGLDVFLAHQTIKVSQQWEDRIRQELHDCQVFIALITTSFIASKWTDQEAGFAMAYGKKIISVLSSGRNPHGFLNRYQGERLKRDKSITSEQIILSIVEDNKLNQSFRNGLIKKFGSSKSFKQTEEIVDKITAISNFSANNLDEIEKYIETNNKIKGTYGADSILRPFIERERQRLSIS